MTKAEIERHCPTWSGTVCGGKGVSQPASIPWQVAQFTIRAMKQVENLRKELAHIYWIGGGSAAGKSTIARRIAKEHGLALYSTDEAMAEHARQSTAEDCPLLHGFMGMNMDERWVKRSPGEMLDTFHWFRGEGFRMIVEDLVRLPTDRRVIAEGFRLLPELVRPLLSNSGHAVWLLPTPEFREAAIERRGGYRFLEKTNDPDRALGNILERDRMFTERLRKDVERLDLQAIEMNVALREDHVARLVSKLFGISDS